jgi:hypothetical protein
VQARSLVFNVEIVSCDAPQAACAAGLKIRINMQITQKMRRRPAHFQARSFSLQLNAPGIITRRHACPQTRDSEFVRSRCERHILKPRARLQLLSDGPRGIPINADVLGRAGNFHACQVNVGQ